MELLHKCVECNRDAVRDEGKSTENWDVYVMTCTYCGGEIKLSLK
ncbi:hypothetical protein BleG1_2833 [Shouchella lehensis G1]|uniref:Uncharacterized protein n=1 Tax=Shouchella lehensis G1 TaxID=1246626 RepID=A0A060LYX7_9BACI|nr:hypothetical protein BleG1_2833 [Shouchella lehensis G1]